MSWSAITEAELVTHISGDELEALRAAALAAGQVDPVSVSITQVTDEVRGYVAGCARNELDTDTTKIPDRLMRAACDMTIAEIIGRVPGYELEEKRQKKYDQAIALMRLVASCKFAIDNPDTGADPGLGIEQANSETRRATRDSMEGL